jgi:hypothetical protein
VAQNLQMRRSTPLTLSTNVLRLDGVGSARSVIIWSTTVALVLVHTTVEGLATDGAAPPTLDARPIPASAAMVEIQLPDRVFLGLAGTGAGTAIIELIP